LKVPFQLNAWFTNNAQLVMHLNSVSDGSIMVVLADNIQLFSTNLQNLDGTYSVDEEYNTNIFVNLPAGQHTITITNTGNDWFYLDWVQLNQVLPASYSGNWLPSPDVIGLRGPHESLLYVVSPNAAFPAGATSLTLPLQHGQTVTMTNWPSGKFFAEWYDPASAAFIGITEAATTNDSLTLSLPDFSQDLAGIVYPPPVLAALGMPGNNAFQMQFNSETGGRYSIEKSTDLSNWTALITVTNVQGTLILQDSIQSGSPRAFYRARQNQ
jgi:hypothetical protein